MFTEFLMRGMDRFRLGQQSARPITPSRLHKAERQGDLRVGEQGAASWIENFAAKPYRALKRHDRFAAASRKQERFSFEEQRLRLPPLQIHSQAASLNPPVYFSRLGERRFREVSR